MTDNLIVDLHSHTFESDGELSVDELLNYAQKSNVDLFSITDHDCLSAYHKLPDNLAMKIIPGVEISCQLDGKELHLVALGVDVANKPLNQLLESNQAIRNERAQWIVNKLIKLQYPDISDSLNELVKGDVVCRTHLAKALVKEGIAKDFQGAFKRYLGRKGKVWKRADWADMSEVIDIVHQAGGKIILAHPTKYKFSATKLNLIIDTFASSGGDAIEVNYSGLNLNHKAWLKRLAKANSLQVSVGSDFHHYGQKWAVPGRFTKVDAELVPVWSEFV